MLQSVFPKTIRGKIILYTAAVTCSIAVFTVTICSFVFQSFLQKNQIQTSEYSLEVICNSTAADLENILSFYKWCSFNTDIAAYLDGFENLSQMPSISSKNSGLRSVALRTYDRLKEEYYNTHSSSYINRVIISPLNSCNYMQISDTTAVSSAHSLSDLTGTDWFQTILSEDGMDNSTFMEDPFLPGSGLMVLPAVSALSGRYSSHQAGWIYMSISDRLILDYLKSFPLNPDSFLCLTIGGRTWLYENDRLKSCDWKFEPVKDLSENAFNSDTSVSLCRLPDGSERVLLSCPIGNYGWSISLLLSQSAMKAQSTLYAVILSGIAVFILFIGLLLFVLLNRSIGRPVKKLQHRIQAIAGGDFSLDPSIQREDEFGAIGTGINRMSQDLAALIQKRIQDEKERKDLEYRILQSQINPHFLYNTLNSIKWMATIQGASGISEMTTALAQLLKSISKGSHNRITLREELNLVKDYFLIQQYRYGGSISLECEISEEALYDCLIHRFTLQPLIENALFHGIEPKGCAGKIRISANLDREAARQPRLIISVWDNGIGMDAETIKRVLSGTQKPTADFFRQVGINNVNQRIRYDCGPEYGISIESVPGEYTCMHITLPYETAQGEIL